MAKKRNARKTAPNKISRNKKTSPNKARPAAGRARRRPAGRTGTGAIAADGADRSSGAGTAPLAPPDERIVPSDLTLHELFAQQSARMLDRADLSEEQKQSLLIGMSCPCCGAGGFSFTAKLRRD